MSSVHTRPINHVAVSVSDIKAVIKWYTQILGFQLINDKILHIKRSEDPSAAIFRIYGDSLEEVKLAYLATANGVGFEIFQFIHPEFKPASAGFDYSRAGVFHICVTDPDPNALAESVVQAGGSRIGETIHPVDGVTCLYVKDPWGHVIEVLDVSYDRLSTTATMPVVASKL